MADLEERLVERLLDQCRHLHGPGEEAPLADALQRRAAAHGGTVTRVHDSVVLGEPAGDRPLVLLVGHLDVVPATEADREPRVEERAGGRVVVGRGTSDMKGGNVVALDLFDDAGIHTDGAYDLAVVLYGGEEGPEQHNQLRDVLATVPWLSDAGLAVVLEPTDLQVQAGCLGGLHALVSFRGRAAHSARPWFGTNALTGAGAFLAELHAREPRPVEVDGIVYHEVVTATQAWTDTARNVVPDRFVVNVNVRVAPNRSLDTAEAELRRLVGDRADVEIVDRAPPAPPALETPLVRRFVAGVDAGVAAKQAWTDVARFAQIGVPAVNFGPGLTAQAHQAGEYVPVANLVAAHHRLRRFLLSDPGDDA